MRTLGAGLGLLAGLISVSRTDAFGSKDPPTLVTLPRDYGTAAAASASGDDGLPDNYGYPGGSPELSNGFTSSPYWLEKYGLQASVDTARCPSTHFEREEGSKSRAHDDKFLSCYDDAIGCANYPRASCSAGGCVFQGCASKDVESFFDLSAYDINHTHVDFNDYKGKVVLVVNVASF